MDELNRCNKMSNVLWLKNLVDHLRIRIKIRPQDGIKSLPKFEEYTNNSSYDFQQVGHSIEEHIFKWQQKVFSTFEYQLYTNKHNCITDIELAYHDLISNHSHGSSKIFTYIHEDYHLPLPDNKKKQNSNNYVATLNSYLKKLNLDESDPSSSSGNLFRSNEDLGAREQWSAMHIAFDDSEYNEESQLLLNQEAILLSIYHNIEENYIILYPDLNNIDTNPYCVETRNGVRLGYQYGVEIMFDDMENGEELMMLLQKVSKKWDKKNRHLLNFEMPMMGRKQYHITLEIVTATNFHADNLYVEYNLKFPEDAKCDNPVHGRSHTSHSLKSEDFEEWSFGHLIELTLEADISTELKNVQVFLEVISVDYWERHRTEGYSYLSLMLQPGYYTKQLSCSRPEELNSIEAESRRFFVGGCNLIKDLDILANPQVEVPYKFKTTGNLDLRISVISQSAASTAPKTPRPRTSSSSALLMGAEAVLRQYRKAKARLAAATKDLLTNDESEL